MTEETLKLILDQWPYFALLLIVWYGFYKFLERTYDDHKEQMVNLQTTFKDSLNLITNTFGGRLDKIEETLEKINK
jgi:hypothetical protein